MKKTLLLIASVALTMAACTNDVAEPNYGDFVKPGEVAFTATSVGTRTSMSANADGGLDIAWVGGQDQIGIFASDEAAPISANAAYSAVESGSYTAFKAVSTAIKWGTGVHSFYAYYPYVEASDLHQTAVPASIPAVQEQAAAGDLAHIEPLAFMYASKEASKGGAVDFSFVNAFSVLEVKLCAAEGTVACDAVIFRATDENEIVSASNIYVNLTNGSLDYSSAEATNEVRVNLAEAVELNTETPASIYAMITPGHAGKTFQAVAVVGGKEVVLGEMAVPEAGIPAGVKATLSLNVTAPEVEPAEAIDLSAAGTANCYIVNKANTAYKFKATVKGNGATTLSGDDAAVAPANAYLLWAQNQTTTNPDKIGYPVEYGATNADNLIVPTSVVLEDGYVSFTTGAEMPNGNAGIVVTDANGTILWSWHLWIVNGYDPAATDVYVATKGVNTYFMDRNLGAFCNYATIQNPDKNDHIASRGLYYQWGRKDPFVGHQSASGYATQGKIYDAEGNGTTKYICYGGQNLGDAVFQGYSFDEIANNTDINKLVAWTVANPNVFVQGTGTSGYTWVGGTKADVDVEWTKLWGNAAIGESLFDKGGVKTMYDPCPVGYRVPSTGHYTFITSHGDQSSTGYGNPFRNWQYNCVEKIYDEAGAAYGKADTGNGVNWAKEAPYGLNYYANGVKTKSEGAQDGVQDYGVLPTDQSTIYFPAQGWIPYGFSCSSNENELQYQTNRPAKGNVNCYRMASTNDGNFYYGWTSVNWGQAMGLPVRCVRDNNVVTPEPEPVDPAVVDLSAEGTANCYVVNTAATTYSFNATVMGNGAAGLTAGLATATGIESTTIAPASASIVWATGSADAPVVTDVELVDGKITFKTPATFVDGNAVIAALDAEGTILWSWHIWALEGYDVEANLVNVTTEAVVGDAYAASWIDRNIGAMNNNANGDLGAYGMYYQWGRKDPFAMADAVWFADGAVRTQPTIEDLGNEAAWTKRGTTSGTNLAEAVLDAIQYPQYYLQGMGNNHNWATNGELIASEAQTDWAALWGNPAANWWASTEALGSKSLFDPCPAGYRLPANAHYRFLSGIQADTYGNGSYGPKWPWRYNCVEATGIAAGSNTCTWKDYTRGWNFYISDYHKGNDDTPEWTYYATGATWYFPATGMTHYNGMMQHGGVDNANGKDRMALAVNQPVANDSKYGSRVDLHYNGTLGGIQYVYNVSNFCEGNACATPARCISE